MEIMVFEINYHLDFVQLPGEILERLWKLRKKW